jgi:hypothetical protein
MMWLHGVPATQCIPPGWHRHPREVASRTLLPMRAHFLQQTTAIADRWAVMAALISFPTNLVGGAFSGRKGQFQNKYSG